MCVFCACMFMCVHGLTAFLPAYTCHTIRSPVSVCVRSQCCVDLLLTSSAVSVCYVCICDCIQYVFIFCTIVNPTVPVAWLCFLVIQFAPCMMMCVCVCVCVLGCFLFSYHYFVNGVSVSLIWFYRLKRTQMYLETTNKQTNKQHKYCTEMTLGYFLFFFFLLLYRLLLLYYISEANIVLFTPLHLFDNFNYFAVSD